MVRNVKNNQPLAWNTWDWRWKTVDPILILLHAIWKRNYNANKIPIMSDEHDGFWPFESKKHCQSCVYEIFLEYNGSKLFCGEKKRIILSISSLYFLLLALSVLYHSISACVCDGIWHENHSLIRLHTASANVSIRLIQICCINITFFFSSIRSSNWFDLMCWLIMTLFLCDKLWNDINKLHSNVDTHLNASLPVCCLLEYYCSFL